MGTSPLRPFNKAQYGDGSDPFRAVGTSLLYHPSTRLSMETTVIVMRLSSSTLTSPSFGSTSCEVSHSKKHQIENIMYIYGANRPACCSPERKTRSPPGYSLKCQHVLLVSMRAICSTRDIQAQVQYCVSSLYTKLDLSGAPTHVIAHTPCPFLCPLAFQSRCAYPKNVYACAPSRLLIAFRLSPTCDTLKSPYPTNQPPSYHTTTQRDTPQYLHNQLRHMTRSGREPRTPQPSLLSFSVSLQCTAYNDRSLLNSHPACPPISTFSLQFLIATSVVQPSIFWYTPLIT